MMVLYLVSSRIQLGNKSALSVECCAECEYIRDQIVPVLALLEATKGHLGSRDVFLGVLEVFELQRVSMYGWTSLGLKNRLTNVPSFHSMPFCLLASV